MAHELKHFTRGICQTWTAYWWWLHYYAFIQRAGATTRERTKKWKRNPHSCKQTFFWVVIVVAAPKRISPVNWLFSSNLHSRCCWCWYYRLRYYCFCFNCDNIFHLLCSLFFSLCSFLDTIIHCATVMQQIKQTFFFFFCSCFFSIGLMSWLMEAERLHCNSNVHHSIHLLAPYLFHGIR